ncbi:carbon storage regulator [Pseudomonas sp. JM0905a]|uniref:carbon storage regulator n=1 Tax=Pseudomonas sp. JM0905a TaxID=2772484 RepID=UPI001CC24633|nr:carbon storage regulator [Pseudomonas sp. JM0905a]
MTLSLLDGVSWRELLELLVTEGVEIRVGAIEGDTVQLTIRAPKRMMIVEELTSAEWPDKTSIHD